VAYEIVERDDGYISVTDAAAYFRPPEMWSPLEHLVADRATGRVLDIGCGAGRHALPLRQQGLDVVGLEPSPGAAAVTRARGIPVVEATVEEAPADLTGFETLLLMGNNLGLLADRATAPRVLESLARMAAPGARLLGLGTDPYSTDNPVHLAYHQQNRERGRMPASFASGYATTTSPAPGSATCSPALPSCVACSPAPRGGSRGPTTVAATWPPCPCGRRDAERSLPESAP
jgi:SAM-dependent methyltransferase